MPPTEYVPIVAIIVLDKGSKSWMKSSVLRCCGIVNVSSAALAAKGVASHSRHHPTRSGQSRTRRRFVPLPLPSPLGCGHFLVFSIRLEGRGRTWWSGFSRLSFLRDGRVPVEAL